VHRRKRGILLFPIITRDSVRLTCQDAGKGILVASGAVERDLVTVLGKEEGGRAEQSGGEIYFENKEKGGRESPGRKTKVATDLRGKESEIIWTAVLGKKGRKGVSATEKKRFWHREREKRVADGPRRGGKGRSAVSDAGEEKGARPLSNYIRERGRGGSFFDAGDGYDAIVPGDWMKREKQLEKGRCSSLSDPGIKNSVSAGRERAGVNPFGGGGAMMLGTKRERLKKKKGRFVEKK